MEIVSVADLKIGMFVAEPDCAWTELPFALQGFVVSTPKQVELFQSKCRFVHVDFSRSLNEYYRAPKREFDRPRRAAAPTLSEPTEQLRFRRRRFLDFLHRQDGGAYAQELASELNYIEPRFDEFHRALQATFQHVEAEQSIDLRNVREGVHDMAGSLKRNPDALMWLLQLKRVDQYSFDHAVDVAVYLLMLGNHIGWRGQKLIELGMAGLLQDVGKSQLPADLLAKSAALSADEQALIRSHVANSLEILYSHANLPSDVLLIVSRHHERWDGSGYPRGL
ncbi:MAG TPA: HD domain-containing phosphohydrolase, partial [Azonexus sp.]|nr:HD domain-containing phosphohydrolase [Azonexus sp.]